jgi:hypothetical protein
VIHGNDGVGRFTVLIVSCWLLLSPALAAAPDKDPQEDLSVKFSTKRAGDEPGTVVGSVTNTSANTYPCVRVEFEMKTRFDLRVPGEKARHLGILSVEVRNLAPQSEQPFQEPLPGPAGIRLGSLTECSAEPSEEPPSKEPPSKEPPSKEPPRPRPQAPQPQAPESPAKEETRPPAPPATCTILGRISGKLHWETKDDRGQPVSFQLTHIFLRTSANARPEHTEVQGGVYAFENVPAGKSYQISAGGYRSEPRERIVSCRPGATHRGVDFEITGPPSSG